MADRERVKAKPVKEAGNYFSQPKTKLSFISSGCQLFDLALGGGFVEGRIINIIGNQATGKSLLCIEASANFAAKYPKGKIRYRECESAFDKGYASALGMPVERVDFGTNQLETVEDLFEDLEDCIKKNKGPELYIVDSLDALSDRAEQGRNMDAGTFGAEKAKKLSQMFRRLVRQMADSQITLIIVSQVRSKIGFVIGRNTTRSGGKALDFYASQIVYLDQLGKLTRTIGGIKRTIGVKIKAKIDKNKVSLPFREAEFQIIFGYGIDDIEASVAWLQECKFGSDIPIPQKDIKKFCFDVVNGSPDLEVVKTIKQAIAKRWSEVETSFLPPRKKYQ